MSKAIRFIAVVLDNPAPKATPELGKITQVMAA